jgi:hypothetical protein
MSAQSDDDISPASRHKQDEVHKPAQRLKRAMSLNMSTQTADDTWGSSPHCLFRSQSRQSLMSDAQVWLTNTLCLLHRLLNFFCSSLLRGHAFLTIQISLKVYVVKYCNNSPSTLVRPACLEIFHISFNMHFVL